MKSQFELYTSFLHSSLMISILDRSARSEFAGYERMRKFRIALICIFLIAAASPVSTAGVGAVGATKIEHPNGLTLIAKHEPGSGLVALEALVKAGAARELPFEAGIGNLVARTLLSSTRNLRAEKLAAIADEVGGNFEALWQPDYIAVRAVTTSARFDDAMTLLGEVLTNAAFDAAAVARAKAEILQEMDRRSEEIFQTAYDEIRLQLYRDNPYRRPMLGYAANIRRLGPEELKNFYARYFVPNNMVIAVVGDVAPEHVSERAKLALAGIGRKELPVDRGVPDEKMTKSRSSAMQRDIRLAYFMIGFLAPGIGSPDFPAMSVASAALGNGKGSRLFRNLREKRGIGYDLGTIYPRMKYQSHLLAYLITDPFKMNLPGFTTQMALEEAKQAFLDEVSAMQQNPLSDEELIRAKRYCIGTYALEHQRLQERAYHLAWLEAIGVGYEFDEKYESAIEAVTKEDVQRVVGKYLNNYALVIILPQDGTHSKPGS